MTTWTDLAGVDPATLVDQIVTTGVNKYDAAKLVNNLVAINLNQAPRHFVFSHPLPTTDPAPCAPTFARTFSHQDWIDGESVVQAGESADDKGFNWRFNALARDIDALHTDTANLFQCLSTLRGQLVQALQDVAAELNRLDTDVATNHGNNPGLNTPPFNVGLENAPQFLGVRELDGSKVTMWKTAQNVMVLPGVDTVGLQDTVTQRLATGGLLVRFAGQSQEFTQALAAGTSVKDLIATYGQQDLGDGRTVANALALLPDDATYQDMATLTDAVNTQEQAVIKSTVGGVDAVSALTGVTSEGMPIATTTAALLATSVATSPVLGSVLGSGLSRAGLTTIADVAGQTPTQLVQRLGQQGVTIDPVQAQELATRASMIAGLQTTR
ncbi:MAG TPA: hypothetical protein VHW64_13725 [Nocardioides sp.]|jgi:hypothetical protein|uniref:hypothetical protein n=1 Tax=Nocardioides sp. TaxID=35761 RepID=UPI002E36B2A0|nr:hypothetical protein [Nocardioides sp.]HEX3931760.1 hypothetical protein [Nocardioides sp.]